MPEIEINDDFKKALELIEKGANVFITGRAGTGKSTFLQYFAANTKKKVVVLAPTGVAAVNVNGQTIHSFFALAPGATPEEAREEAQGRKPSALLKELETIVIDEISMVRSDLLDCVDVFLRTALGSKAPFAGKQMVFIGDLYQLPPVVKGGERHAFGTHYASQYFFDSKVFGITNFVLVEFQKIYRQNDRKFIELLNKIRNNSIDEHEIGNINACVAKEIDCDDGCIHLTTLNKMADALNEKKLAEINEKQHSFRGFIEGNFSMDYLPAELVLKLKKGAQVMFIANDQGRRWVNGSLGEITKISRGAITAKIFSGREVKVTPHTWEIFNYRYNPEKNSIEKDIIGTFTQYPIRLAWAITIHKSQGKTFDKVTIDVGRGAFTSGQMYVALSRCRTLEGIKIKTPIRKQDIWLDWRIVKFLTRFQYAQSERHSPNKRYILHEAINNMQKLRITYLKPNDEKTCRVITPIAIKKMEYLGHEFEGLEAFCHAKRDRRNFKIERILEIKPF